VSQSPSESTGNQDVSLYRQGWSALNRLLHEDKSFSGSEKNCAFLNLGGNSFADVSSIAGFDFMDDGRALLSCDWDFDGDLDLWVSSRTAPRLRFLLNQSEKSGTDADFISLWLQGNGVTVNRDAIGARVSLFFKNSEEETPYIRLLQGGDAFLSQESHWLNFQFPADSEIDRIEVAWPAGRKQVYRNLAPGQFYIIAQGTEPVVWQPPSEGNTIAPSNQNPFPVDPKARIVINSRLPLPPIYVSDGESIKELPESRIKGPLLINLWATWCGPCVDELRSLTESRHQIEAAGLRILALNAELENAESASRILDKLGFPFESGNAATQTALNLDLFHRAYLDRWTALPVPSSFLVDETGEVAVIYKGPVEITQLLEDLNLLGLDPLELREKSVPFKGRWMNSPKMANPAWINSQFVAHDHVEEGVKYLSRFLKVKSGSGVIPPKSLAGLYFTVGMLLLDEGHPIEAQASLRKAVALYQADYRPYFQNWTRHLDICKRRMR
jgi:thiol-disulfide isomerase/thioredoxin